MLRVLWRINPPLVGELQLKSLPTEVAAVVSTANKPFPLLEIEPVFSLTDGVPLLTAAGARKFTEPTAEDLGAFFHAFVPDQVAADQVLAHLRSLPSIVDIEVQRRPQPAVRMGTKWLSHAEPPRAMADDHTIDNYQDYQQYLEDAPEGVGARSCWRTPGGDGVGVKIIDIESGWSFSHVDLVSGMMGLIFGQNPPNWRDHGTAVLGILSGDRNAFGVTGVSPGVRVGAASASYDATTKWNAENAILTASSRLVKGDIIVLEMHQPGPHSLPNQAENDQTGFVPIEIGTANFKAIRHAVEERGVHVVEAAGNGGENLDHAAYSSTLAGRDSGAIMVGGGHFPQAAVPRSRIWWSNYGRRVNLQAWGEGIVTTGGHDEPDYCDLNPDPDPDRCYTQSFGGTSGATPIVAGAVACIVGALRAKGRAQISPTQMRDLLVRTGTAQQASSSSGLAEHIGPMPNIRRALAELGVEVPTPFVGV